MKAVVTATTTNPYDALLASRVPLDHHESDLYVLATEEARAIVTRSGWGYATFRSQVDRKVWLDLPFAYRPFWEQKERG